MDKSKIIISVEGNIGAGKTSIIDLLKQSHGDIAEFIYEPVDEWMAIKGDDGKNLLETFYGDKQRWSYTFQNVAYITRMSSIVEKINNSQKKYIILDRSLSADLNTFAKMLHDDGLINSLEWDAYNKWNNFFDKHYGPLVEHKIIYLRCEPEIAHQRIQLRNRDAEKGIPLDYLKLLHKYHDDWLLKHNNVLILDVNNDFVGDKENFKTIYNMIIGFIGTDENC
jgi:deoxycitidine kinase/deoxyguanosine kinase